MRSLAEVGLTQMLKLHLERIVDYENLHPILNFPLLRGSEKINRLEKSSEVPKASLK